MASIIEKPFAILANPEGKAWDFTNRVYAKLKEKEGRGLESEIKMIEVKMAHFRDGELKLKITENVRDKICFYIHDCSLKPAEWFAQLPLVNFALKYASAFEIIDVVPYMLFSRQDRKDESRVAISAKVVADMISAYANRVITLDLHAPQIQGFYSIPLDNLYSSLYAARHIFSKHPELLKEELSIMSPDAGGVPRARQFIDDIMKKYNKDARLVTGYKYRPKAGEIGDYRLLGEVKEQNVLVVDDILDSGGTLIRASKTLKDAGAKDIYAYVTHGIFTEGFEKLKPYFKKVFVSNSRNVFFDDNQFELIDLSDLFAEAIYRTAKGMSLSALFEGQL